MLLLRTKLRQVAERKARTAFYRVWVRAQEEFMDVIRRMSFHKRRARARAHTHTHCRRICDKTKGSGSSATSVPRDAYPIFTGFLGLRPICTTLLELQRTQSEIIYIHDVHKWDSAVGIAARYVLDGPRIEFRWGRGIPYPSRPAIRPTQPPIQWVPGLSLV